MRCVGGCVGPPVPRVPGDMLPGGPEGPRREVGSGTDKFNDDLRFTTGEDDLVCRGGGPCLLSPGSTRDICTYSWE